jgi:hypothetical protein
MRAYKFLNAHYGLESLRKKRLKQSRMGDLNDPFELTPFDLTDPALRKIFHKTRADLEEERGMLCFSVDWRNPVIWAHYSDKHKGLCLGFEIPNQQEDPANDEIGLVEYIEKPRQLPTNYLEHYEDLPDMERFAFVRQVLFTKFNHWKYEQEIRVWAPLQNEEKGLSFVSFGETLQLVEVIIGAKCALSRGKIVDALGPLAEKVKISKARAAYDNFEMVEDQGAPVAGATMEFTVRINVKAVLAVVAIVALAVGSFFAGEHHQALKDSAAPDTPT